jgi:hypothetical protein
MATPKTGNPNGRPTKYKPEYCESIVHYFHNHNGFPTIEGFAVYECDVDPDTLLNWQKKYPDFLGAVKKAKAIQKHRLNEGGMAGTLNTAYAIFFAKNNCGMSDKTEVIQQLDMKADVKTTVVEVVTRDQVDDDDIGYVES